MLWLKISDSPIFFIEMPKCEYYCRISLFGVSPFDTVVSLGEYVFMYFYREIEKNLSRSPLDFLNPFDEISSQNAFHSFDQKKTCGNKSIGDRDRFWPLVLQPIIHLHRISLPHPLLNNCLDFNHRLLHVSTFALILSI